MTKTSIYTKTKPHQRRLCLLLEVNMYGSGLLSTYKPNVNLSNPPAVEKVVTANGDSLVVNKFVRGQKNYILTNHLGNVMVVISDKKKGVFSSGVFQYYAADVVSATDYYPFGVQMPGRTYNSEKSTRGFNGQEKSTELNRDGNLYTAEFWEYDARVGRRWNVDPKPTIGIGEYSVFLNNPIWRSDILGDSSVPSFVGPMQVEQQLKKENGRNVVGAINSIYEKSGGDQLFNKQMGPQQLGATVTGETSVPDLKDSPSGTEFNEYTNVQSALNVKPTITASPKGWINLFMGHFIKGTGPENWAFPLNGSVSEQMRDAFIVNNALSDWYNWHYLLGRQNTEFHMKSAYDLMGQIDDLGSNLSPFSMSNFVGSADVYIKMADSKTLLVRIVNITSVTSGDFKKHLPFNKWPKSLVRDPNNPNPQPYTNISQTFQLTYDVKNVIEKYNILE